MKPILIICSSILFLSNPSIGVTKMVQGSCKSRFFFSGNGLISLLDEKNGRTFNGRYRRGPIDYDPEALAAISLVFDAPRDELSIRLIEFLDYLEDRLRPGVCIRIVSGYRDPQYNTRLRNKGGLAAEASLHQYGMAADFKIDGVAAKDIWEFVKTLGFGGTGFYHGKTVHVDVGPARYWDEKTSGVGSDISKDNKLIGIVTDRDIYLPQETITLKFIRMTAFPIHVASDYLLIPQGASDDPDQAMTFTPSFAPATQGDCPEFHDIPQMAGIRWQLPEALPPGRYKVCARFCSAPWPQMPIKIYTPEFEIARP